MKILGTGSGVYVVKYLVCFLEKQKYEVMYPVASKNCNTQNNTFV
jgi:hypothetical protein